MPDYRYDTDVTNSDVCQYYYDGILWAAANGITTGTGANLFAPNTK